MFVSESFIDQTSNETDVNLKSLSVIGDIIWKRNGEATYSRQSRRL